MIPKPLAITIVVLITIVWLGNFIAQFVVTGYEVDGWIHTIFLTVVGGALGLSRKGNSGSGNDDPPGGTVSATAPSPPNPPEPSSGDGSNRAPFRLRSAFA